MTDPGVADPSYRAAGALVFESDDDELTPSRPANAPEDLKALSAAIGDFHDNMARLGSDPASRQIAVDALLADWVPVDDGIRVA